jgi:hypothetical protein
MGKDVLFTPRNLTSSDGLSWNRNGKPSGITRMTALGRRTPGMENRSGAASLPGAPGSMVRAIARATVLGSSPAVRGSAVTKPAPGLARLGGGDALPKL